MGASDDLSDVVVFLFLIWIGFMVIAGIVTFFNNILNRKPYCSIHAKYDCQLPPYTHDMERIRKVPKQLWDASITMPGDSIHARQRAAKAREKIDKILRGD